MSPEIGHFGEPDLKFDNGLAHVPDLNITAALLSLSGAAWDGRNQPVYKPDSTDKARTAEWLAALEEPAFRQIHVERADDYKAVVILPVIRKDGWTDRATGKHYAEGEPAPTPRIIDMLRGEYRYRTDGAVTRRVPWTETDWRFWWQAWFTGLLSGARIQVEKRNELLDRNREKYDIHSNFRSIGGGNGD